jgi:hypothetical protein
MMCSKVKVDVVIGPKTQAVIVRLALTQPLREVFKMRNSRQA